MIVSMSLRISSMHLLPIVCTPRRIRTDTLIGLKPIASANWATGAKIGQHGGNRTPSSSSQN